jgi:hypothetical protein
MVVDADQLVPSLGSQVSNERGLAAAGGALQQDRVLPVVQAERGVCAYVCVCEMPVRQCL